MKKLTTVEVGQQVRVRVRRSWLPATVIEVGTAFGGAPSARLLRFDSDTSFCELVSKLRPAENQEAK